MIKRALVTDGKESTTLAVVQSLGKAGVRVTVGDDHRLAPSRFSKYCKRFFSYPSPEISASNYLEILLRELNQSQADMFFLTSDTQMPIVMNYWNEISKLTRIVSPPPETLAKVFDKSKTLALAESLGVPTPKTTPGNWGQSRRDSPQFPVVVKHTQTYYWQGDRLRAAPRVEYVFSAEELNEKLKAAPFGPENILLQEFVPGPGIGLFGLFKNGKPVALFSHERLREANPTGGASAEAKSIAITGEARDIAAALMEALHWTGAAMIEFKKDLNTGRLKLMEVNGRFWGSLPLAIRAGIDFPILTAQLFETGTVSPQVDYPVNLRARHLNRYFTHLLHVLKGKPTGWTGRFPGRIETLIDLIRFRQRGLFYYGFDWSDPVPAIADLVYWFQSYFKKLLNLSGFPGVGDTSLREASPPSGSVPAFGKRPLGVLHVHSSHSFDSEVPLESIAQRARTMGLQFICVTEHTNELDETRFEHLVNDCRRLSDSGFTLIPGLEITCDDGTHVLAFGLSRWITERNLTEILMRKKDRNVIFVLAHPTARTLSRLADSPALQKRLQGIEVWNRKYHGLTSPYPKALTALSDFRTVNQSLWGFAGSDVHDDGDLMSPLIQVECREISPDGIIEALAAGRFRIQHRAFELASDGTPANHSRLSLEARWILRTLIFRTLKWIKGNIAGYLFSKETKLRIEKMIRRRL